MSPVCDVSDVPRLHDVRPLWQSLPYQSGGSDEPEPTRIQVADPRWTARRRRAQTKGTTRARLARPAPAVRKSLRSSRYSARRRPCLEPPVAAVLPRLRELLCFCRWSLWPANHRVLGSRESGRPGGFPPGLPRIRTCGSPASGGTDPFSSLAYDAGRRCEILSHPRSWLLRSGGRRARTVPQWLTDRVGMQSVRTAAELHDGPPPVCASPNPDRPDKPHSHNRGVRSPAA